MTKLYLSAIQEGCNNFCNSVVLQLNFYKQNTTNKEKKKGGFFMLIFVAIALSGLLLTIGSHIFGDHDMDHDHDVSHDAGGSGESTVSIFSMKVISTFIMTFGAAGAVARYYDLSYPNASFVGASSGVFFAIVMWLVYKAIYKQQGSSVVNTSDAVGLTATVVTPIDQGAIGEVGMTMNGRYCTFMACSNDGKPIDKDKTVIVEKVVGGKLTVKTV